MIIIQPCTFMRTFCSGFFLYGVYFRAGSQIHTVLSESFCAEAFVEQISPECTGQDKNGAIIIALKKLRVPFKDFIIYERSY